MTEQLKNDIVRGYQAGTPIRRLARELGVDRKTVKRVVRRFEIERSGQAPAPGTPRPPACRPSQLNAYTEFIHGLLERYPHMTAVRVHEELRARGFRGSYTIVRDYLRRVRPRPAKEPVVRFETPPGAQAQMDYSSYDIDFTDEGRRRVHLFGYVLSWSRRQYLRFVESQDFTTTLREHVRAFQHLQGVAATCLYDNMKVVVLRHDDEGPLYNPRFLAFATHYGFKPWACRVRRPQTKGKTERQFDFAEKNLLNGRTFRTLEHLNEVTAWWLANVADVRQHRETKQRPIDRHAEEVPRLIPLPAQDYHVHPVIYRVVNVEGFVSYRQNSYSVPWRLIGQIVPVQITETEAIIYEPTSLEEIARHRLLARNVTGQRLEERNHRPRDDSRQDETLLRERFAELGPIARRFLEGLLRDQRCGKAQARRVLTLLATYTRQDWLAALDRALRFGAYSAQAVERILAAQAKPKSPLEALADEATDTRHLQPLLDDPVRPRPPSEYLDLIEDSHDPTPNEENVPDEHDTEQPE